MCSAKGAIAVYGGGPPHRREAPASRGRSRRWSPSEDARALLRLRRLLASADHVGSAQALRPPRASTIRVAPRRVVNVNASLLAHRMSYRVASGAPESEARLAQSLGCPRRLSRADRSQPERSRQSSFLASSRASAVRHGHRMLHLARFVDLMTLLVWDSHMGRPPMRVDGDTVDVGDRIRRD